MLQKSWTPSSPCSAPATWFRRSKRATVDAETRNPENVAAIRAKTETLKASFAWRKLDSPEQVSEHFQLPAHRRALSPALAASRVRTVRLPVPLLPPEPGHVSRPPCCCRRGLFLTGDTSSPEPRPAPSPAVSAAHAPPPKRTHPFIISYYSFEFHNFGLMGLQVPPPTHTQTPEFPVFPLSCITRNVPLSQNLGSPNVSNYH